MKINVKLRQIGNSLGVLLPKESLLGYNKGDLITLEVITKDDKNAKIDRLKGLIDPASYNKEAEKGAESKESYNDYQLEQDDSIKRYENNH